MRSLWTYTWRAVGHEGANFQHDTVLGTIMTMPILNLAAYQFSPVADLESVRRTLRAEGRALGIKGTILVTPEGLNAFLAGAEEPCRKMLACLRQVPGFEAMPAKESWSAQPPFMRFKVKLKKEIIRMDRPTIRPAHGRAPAVDSQTLERWLDQGHDDAGNAVVMLDTRNGYEIDVGMFKNALDLGIQKFTQFPEAVQKHKEALQGKTVVSYCTGGIRCEKAALFMQEIGFPNVYQLDGGVLKYFADTAGRHWQGECFVFDDPAALSDDLTPRAQNL